MSVENIAKHEFFVILFFWNL